MIFAMHAKALYEALTAADEKVISRYIAPSRIVVSEVILDHFEEVFQTPTERQLLHSFLAKAGVAGHIRMIGDVDNGDVVNSYENAAHFGGKNLVICSNPALSPAIKKKLTKRGTRLLNIAGIAYKGAQVGIDPFERHILPHNKKQSPELVIGPFFTGASSAVFYDKFFNAKSCSLVSLAASLMLDDAKLDLVTSGNAALSIDKIRQLVTLKGNQRLQIEIADGATIDFLHDRYCYIDSNYEIHMPRGLDSFGQDPGWRNVNASVSIHDSHDGRDLTIRCSARGGRAAERSITVRSKLIA